MNHMLGMEGERRGCYMRILVKIAGALLDEGEAGSVVLAQQIAQLAKDGHELLVVHGGGKILAATLKTTAITNCGRPLPIARRDVAVMVMGGLLDEQRPVFAPPGSRLDTCPDASCFLAEPMMQGDQNSADRRLPDGSKC